MLRVDALCCIVSICFHLLAYGTYPLTVTLETESTLEPIIHTSLGWLRDFRGFGVETRVLSELTTNPEKYQAMLGHTE